jgi:hypothetical protein
MAHIVHARGGQNWWKFDDAYGEGEEEAKGLHTSQTTAHYTWMDRKCRTFTIIWPFVTNCLLFQMNEY